MNSSVIHVSPYYPPHLGGVEVVAEQLARAQHCAGIPVQVFTTSCGAPGAATRERQNGVPVRRYRGVELAHTPVAPGLFFGLLRAPATSIVHLHIAHALIPELVRLSSALRHRPYVLHFHLDVDASGPAGRLLPAYKEYFFGPAVRAAVAVIVLTEEQRDFVQDRYRVAPEKVFVVPNGVSPEFLAIRRQHQPEAKRPMALLYFGRISPQKNLPRLIAAMAQVPPEVARLTIVGDGEDLPMVRQLLDQPGPADIILRGPEYGAQLRHTMAEHDAFVLPSNKEGMPLVVLEAMASGMPVIATNVPGTRELVQERGILTKPNSADLALAIKRLAGDHSLRLRLAEAGRQYAEKFTWTQVATRVSEVYKKVGL